MRVLSSSRHISESLGPFAVALGIFDGVHLGHRALLTRVVELAKEHDLRSLAYSFDPHPAHVLAPQSAPRLIEPIDMRLERFAALGIETVLLEHFDREIAEMTAETFVNDVLKERLRVRHVVVGVDFTFGHRGQGNVELLRVSAPSCGYELHAIDKVERDGVRVSSTAIRRMIVEGDVEGAARLLGRPYTLMGPVVRGAGRGNSIGIPTANIAQDEKLEHPGIGVYAAVAEGPFGRKLAVVNVGRAPTFEDQELKIEAHLLDYDGAALYGAVITLALFERLRQEERFDGIDALKAQIARDIEQTRAVLRGHLDS